MNEPYVALQTVMLPRDSNAQGSIFGGVILSMIDMAAYVGVRRLVMQAAGTVPHLVTVAINRVEFHKPVFVGDVVRCLVSPVKFGRTSVTVRVTVEAEQNAEMQRVTEAEVVYVGVDPATHRPTPLVPEK